MNRRSLSFRQAAVLVARREFGQRIRDRSFFVSTAITVGIIAVVALLPRFTDLGEDAFDVAESQLQVHDLQAADSAVAASLWRFLLDIDLVNQVRVVDRPLDEPLELWLTDRRQCRTVATYDDLWLRLVDVETALQQRAFGSAEPVTIEVADSMLPTNSGCYRISGQGVERSTGQPQLSMDVATLASLYLGDHPVSRMVEAGRIQVHDAEAVPRAEELFRTGRLPWCGTNF